MVDRGSRRFESSLRPIAQYDTLMKFIKLSEHHLELTGNLTEDLFDQILSTFEYTQ